MTSGKEGMKINPKIEVPQDELESILAGFWNGKATEEQTGHAERVAERIVEAERAELEHFEDWMRQKDELVAEGRAIIERVRSES